MSSFEVTPRNQVRRKPERASYDAETVYAILDAAQVCHMAFVEDGQPFVIPTQFGRIGDVLVVHGSYGSRLMKLLQAGAQVSVSVAVVDGLVVARSVMHHSANYHSAVVFGRGRKLESDEEKLAGLRAFTEKVLPGRWEEARPPSPAELRGTALAAIDIHSASAKVRSGPPIDAAEDLALPVWAGVIPLRTTAGPLAGESDQPVPTSVRSYLDKNR